MKSFERLNILVIAYQVSPSKGSEYSVAWNYITHMSKFHNLDVICGTSGKHMGEFSDLKLFLQTQNIPNTNFHFVSPNRLSKCINLLNEYNIFVYAFYIAYRIWQNTVFNHVKRLCKNKKVDLIHFVSPIGFREPGYIWKLKIPYVWGPISGFENINWAFWKHLSFKGRLKFFLRFFFNFIHTNFNLRIRCAINESDTIISATNFTKNILFDKYNKNSLYIPENSIIGNYEKQYVRFNEILKIIWIGRIDEFKGLKFLINALQQCKRINNIKLTIVGDGPLKKNIFDFVNNNGLQANVSFLGHVPQDNVIDEIKNSNIHVITSMKEGNPTTIWECLKYGIPTISFNHSGMSDSICDKCGFLIDINDVDLAVSNLAKLLDDIIEHPKILDNIYNTIDECAINSMWNNRIQVYNNIYSNLLKQV
jgi:glycosyltransferase involved in cell wall biosynthesis